MADNTTRILITAQDDASSKLAKVSQGLSQAGQSAASFAGQFGLVLAPIAAAAAAVASFKSSLDFGGKLNDMAMSTGATVEQLSALRNVAELSGVSLDEAGKGLQKLSRNMLEAATGNKDAAATFKALGVSITDSKGALRDSGQVMQDVAKSISGLASPTERVAAAQLAFGKAGASLVPMLMDIANGAEMVATWTAKDAALADELGDNLTKLAQHSRAAGETIAKDLLGPLNVVADAMANTAEQGNALSVASAGVKTFFETILVLGVNVAYVLTATGKEIGGIAAQVAALATLDFKGFSAIGQAMKEDAAQARKEIDELSARILNPPTKAAASSGGAASPALASLINGAKQAKEEVDKLAAVLDKINGKDVGLDASYWKDLQTLNAGYKAGKIDIDQYRDAVGKLTTQQKFWTDGLKAAEQTHKDAIEFYKSEEAALKAFAKAQEDSTKQYGDLIDSLELETKTIGMTSDERERYVALKKLDQQYTAGLIESEDDYLARVQAVNAAFAQRNGQKAYFEGQQSMWTGIEKTAHDTFISIFDSGKSAFERLRGVLKNTVYELLYQMTVKQWIISIAGSMGASPATLAALAGGGGGGNSALGLLNGANSAYNLYTGSPTAVLANGVTWLGGATGSVATSAFGAGMGATAAGADVAAAVAAYESAAVAATAAGDAAAAAAYAEAAGGISAGSTAATAIPYVGWVIAAIALIASFSGKGGGPKTEGDALYNLTGGTPTYGGSEGFFTGSSGDAFAKKMTSVLAVSTTDMLKALGGSGAGIGVLLGFNTDPMGTAPDNITGAVQDASGKYSYLHTFDAGRGDYAAQMAVEAKRVMLAAIQASDVNEAYKSIIRNVDLMTASAEQLDQAMQDVNNVYAIMHFGSADPFADYAASMESAGQSFMAQLDKQSSAVLKAAAAYDGSSASIKTLMDLTNQRYSMEMQLAAQLADAVKSTSTMFGDSKRNIQLSVLGDQGKYDFYNKEVQKYSDVLATLTDPQLISEYASKLNGSIMSAWGVLDSGQQGASSQKFLDLLDNADKLAQERFEAVKTTVAADNTAMQKAISDAIAVAMTAAAQQIAAAASIPTPVAVTVDVTGLGQSSEVVYAGA